MYGLEQIKEMNRGDKAERYRVQRDRLAQALERVLKVAPAIPGDVANFAASAMHAAAHDLDEDEDGNPPNIQEGGADDAGPMTGRELA